MLMIAAIIWKVVDGAWPAIQHSGSAFVWQATWNPVTNAFGAREFIIGTIVTSFGAMLIAAPLAVAIALFLTELAPRAVRGADRHARRDARGRAERRRRPLGDPRARPVRAQHVEPLLQRYLGCLPIFGGTPSQSAMLPAILVLTIMVIPITSSICRELFLGVPQTQGGRARARRDALGDGARRHRPVRAGGIVAAIILGLGRALGEAIAVTQVIGNTRRITSRSSRPATRSRAGSRASTRAPSRISRSPRSSTSR